MGEISIRVYYEDTDSGGVVYYANYLKFIERGRSEYLRDLGFEQDALIANHNTIFVVRRLNAQYHLPAKFNDLLTVQTLVKKNRACKFSFCTEDNAFRAKSGII